jgi:hypothetical protein
MRRTSIAAKLVKVVVNTPLRTNQGEEFGRAKVALADLRMQIDYERLYVY